MHFMVSRAGIGLIAASLTVALSGCGGKKDTANVSEVQLKDLETADGTINDAMTDLDGAQTEGTTVIETGNRSSSAGKTPDTASNASEPEKPAEDSEVVADQ